MTEKTKYSLVCITLVDLEQACDIDIIGINGDKAGIKDDIHCIGSMIYEYEQEGWTAILTFCGITGDMIDKWYAESKHDFWNEAKITMVLACHYIHYPSNPYSPEEFDATFEFIGVVDADKLIESGLMKMKEEKVTP